MYSKGFQPPFMHSQIWQAALQHSLDPALIMAVLMLILWHSLLLSGVLVDPQQVLGGRVDGQASPEDVLALLHQTLPLALPWDRAWLGSLQVPAKTSEPSRLNLHSMVTMLMDVVIRVFFQLKERFEE